MIIIDFDFNGNKGFRLLDLYEKLNRGERVVKSELASLYNVTEKTIQRDIDDLRTYLAETHLFENEVAIKFDKSSNTYYLVHLEREWLTNEEVLAICKVMLESRAFSKEELERMLAKITMQVSPKDKILVDELLCNEIFHYIPPQHGKTLLSPIWELSNFILKHEIIEISYTRKDGVTREHLVKPVAIMFSEYYFYLIAFMADNRKDYPTVFRIDRIAKYKCIGEKFRIPYKDKFSDGEFRKRVQFMFSGELRTVKFQYNGPSIEAVLDRLPTAEILEKKEGIYTVKVEVYGKGIDMWLRSQGEKVKVLV